MRVTWLGIVIKPKDEQVENTPSGSSLIESGRTTDFKDSQNAKAYLSIVSTVLGKTIDVN